MYNDLDVIIENIYLGNYEASENIQKLKELEIKKVLSLLDMIKVHIMKKKE